MAPKHAGTNLVPDDPLVYLMPNKLSGSAEVEKQGIRLTIESKVEDSAGAFYAKLDYFDERTESCVALRKGTLRAFETFDALNACSHQNIAKPIGVWEDKARNEGYVVFQNFDGLLSSIPKEVIFEAENLSEPEPAMLGFSKTGFNIMSDVMSAVKYVNDRYQQKATQTENFIPLKSLRIEARTVFYQLKEEEDYLVLLCDFESDTGGSQTVKGRKKKKGKPVAGNSGEEPDVHMICAKNWSNLGNYIKELYSGWNPNFEVTHFVDKLKEDAVRYEDLVWEAGLWDLSTKVFFIREIFWCYDKDVTRKADLGKRLPLGLQNCITTLKVTEPIDEDTPDAREQDFEETNLFKSVKFLRVFILAHQSDIVKGYGGRKDEFPDKKSAERFVLKAKVDYMVRLIEEIRNLNWIETSPYLRSRNNYMIERHPPKNEN